MSENTRPPKTFTQLYKAIENVMGPDKYFSVRVEATQSISDVPVSFTVDVYIHGHKPNGWSQDCQSFVQAWYEFCRMVGHDSTEKTTIEMVDVEDKNEHISTK